MTPAEMILEQLANWKPTGDGPHVLHVTKFGSETSFTLSAAQADAFSLLLHEVAFITGPTIPCCPADLAHRAEEVATRVKCLAEPLTVYEVDACQSKALLRSISPLERSGKLSYYEMALSGFQHGNLKRYQVNKTGGRRSSVSFPLTHEALAQLIEEMAIQTPSASVTGRVE